MVICQSPINPRNLCDCFSNSFTISDRYERKARLTPGLLVAAGPALTAGTLIHELAAWYLDAVRFLRVTLAVICVACCGVAFYLGLKPYAALAVSGTVFIASSSAKRHDLDASTCVKDLLDQLLVGTTDYVPMFYS